jgi:hypothetical protein
LLYSPNPDFNGNDSFTFKANDGKLDSAIATITIAVTPVNDRPVADAQSVSVNEDHSVGINITGSDLDGDALTFDIIDLPAHGSLSGTAPALVYTPSSNYFGSDSFSFRVSDGQTSSEPAQVSISIAPVNDAPVADASATPLRSLTALNNLNATAVLDGSRSTDIDNDPLRFRWTEGAVSIATGMVAQVTLPIGSHNIVLNVSDGLASSTDGVTINVVAAANSAQPIIDLLRSAQLPSGQVRPLLASLQAANAAFARGQVKTAVNELRAFQNKVRAQLGRSNPSLALELIKLAQTIIDAALDPAPQPRLSIKSHGHSSGVTISFSGGAGQAYVIEASYDMAHWEKVGTASHLGGGEFEFKDDRSITNKHVRFYRVQAAGSSVGDELE